MLKIENISKAFDSKLLFSDVSFEIGPGVIGIWGAKGVGKSSLLAIIAGTLKPDSGNILIDGYDISKYPVEAKKATGYMPENMAFYEDMTPYEFLTFIGSAKKVPTEKLHKQVGEALDLLNISYISDVLISSIGADERRFLAVAAALLGNPDVIILDSPFENVSYSAKEKLSYIVKMLGTMKTVIVSSETSDVLEGVASSIIDLSHTDDLEVEE